MANKAAFIVDLIAIAAMFTSPILAWIVTTPVHLIRFMLPSRFR